MTARAYEDVTHMITAVLAVHGGLNDRSKRALLEIARSQGYGADEILSILEQVAHHDHDATILAVTHAADAPDPRDEDEHRSRMDRLSKVNRAARITLAILTVSLFAASAILLVLSALTMRGINPLARVDESRIVLPPRERLSQSQVVAPLSSGDSANQQEPEAFDASTYDALLSPFDEAPERFRSIGSEALTPIAASISNISNSWTSLDRVSIEAAANRIANLLLILEKANVEYASRLLELVLLPSSHLAVHSESKGDSLAPAGILPAAWSVGVASRLTKETYANAGIRAQIEAHIMKIFPPEERPKQPSFRSGATATVELLARTAIDSASLPFAAADNAVWGEIRRSLLSLSSIKAQPTRDAVLGLMTYILETAPSSSSSSATTEAISTLAQLIDWNDRESGQAILSWFDDADIPTAHLAAFMRVLEQEPSLPDLAATQPLTAASPPIQRATIRDQIASVFTLPQSPTDGWIEHKWTPAMVRVLSGDSVIDSDDLPSTLAHAVEAARLSSAASLRWSGSIDEADQMLLTAHDAETEARNAIGLSSIPDVDLASLTSPAGGSDGRFALSYINAKRNTGLRLEAISSLAASSADLGPADADVLAGAALFGVPIEVRAAAQSEALRNRTSIVMTHALLERLPEAPRIDISTEFFERFLSTRLPEPSDPLWTQSIRAHLLAMLQDQISAQRAPLIDRLRAKLRDANELRLTVANRAGAGSVARREYHQMLALASQYRGSLLLRHAPERVALRHGRRTAIADGPVQSYVADRLSTVELFAYAVVAERPSNEARVSAVLARLDRQRADAANVVQQIAHIERAALTLWGIRLAADFTIEGLHL